jgi:predicted RNase H-like HicB family nuclease
MKQLSLNSIVWQEDEHFVAQCLNVDVSCFGSTRKEALANLTEALELYFEDTTTDAIQPVKDPEIITTSIRA